MNKLLLLAALCWIAAPASRVWAQDSAPRTAPQTPVRSVSVIGEAEKPGVFPFVPGETATALLERAGGATAVASVAKIYVLREGLAIPFDPSQTEENAPGLALREGDVLVVPQTLRRISVVGDVVRPSSFALTEEQTLSVADALTLAGGISPSANQFNVVVLRRSADGTVESYSLPKDPDMLSRSMLQDEDVVYVRVKRNKRVRPGVLQLLDYS